MKKLLAAMLFLALVVAVLCALCPPVTAYPTGWTVQQQLAGTDAVSCDVAAFTTHVWVTWRTTSNSIWVKHSDDYGVTWSTATCLDNGVYGNLDPVVVSGNTGEQRVYILFPGKRNGGGHYQTQVCTSINWGDSWGLLWNSTGATDRIYVDATSATPTSIT